MPQELASSPQRDQSSSSAGVLRPFMPELDTLRGLACLAVVFLHGFSWSYGGRLHFSKIGNLIIKATLPGWMGVNLFFVLSGFLITGILLDSKSNPGYYRRFYVRRALRILPACYTLLIVLYVLGQAPMSFVAVGFAYLANLTYFLGVPMAYGPLWSLAVEEHFYIAWPFIVKYLTAWHLAIVSAFLIVAEPLLRGLSFYAGHPRGIDWYTWFVLDGLAAGSLLAIVLRSGITRKNLTILCGTLLTTAVAAAIVGAPFGILTRERLLGAALQFSVVHLLFTGMVLLFLIAGSGQYRGLVNNRVLKFFGYISYGLYLVHMLIFRLWDSFYRRFYPELQPRDWRFDLVMLRFVLVLGTATLVSYLSRRYYEEKFLRLKERFAPEESKNLT